MRTAEITSELIARWAKAAARYQEQKITEAQFIRAISDPYYELHELAKEVDQGKRARDV